MSGVYSVEDLLKLRNSPLVCRPPNLPPIEEWMGTQDTGKRPATRGRHDDNSLHPEGFQKRSGIDAAQRKQTTDPERIVLGPPRRSFASSSGRPFGKPTNNDSEDLAKDGSGHERSKTSEELEYKVGERRGFGASNRFTGRTEQNSSHNERPRRRFDDDEGESRPRRDHEKARWGARDGRDDKGGDEQFEENGSTRPSHRSEAGRGKFVQPWFRTEKIGDEGQRDNDRGWRRDRDRVRDGDWDTPTRNELDPEWMDSIDGAEPQQARTQEDFQRWKERMKAGNSAAEAKQEQSVAQSEAIAITDDSNPSSTIFSGIISPDPAGNSMDKFFARFEKNAADQKATAPKPMAKTRFASLFGPPPEPKSEPISAQPPQFPPAQSSFLPTLGPAPASTPTTASAPAPAPASVPATAPIVSADADQAGFQRILEMLGKRDSGVAQSSDIKKSKAPAGVAEHSHQRNASPDLVALFKQEPFNRKTPVTQPPPVPTTLERLLSSRSPAEHQTRSSNTPNKDELLLNLLRQAEISAKPQPQQSYQQYGEQRGLQALFGPHEPSRGGPHPASETERPQMQERGGNRMFDDPAISSMPYQDEIRSRENAQRMAANANATTSYEEQYMESLRSNGHQQKPMYNLPPGLQRPPGLDQMSRMPPAWNEPQGPAPSSQQRPAPPPGLGSRGLPPHFANMQQSAVPPMQQQNPAQGMQRPPAQRKYTGESSISNFPPGMGPPPGFMPHGPPPGFQHANAAQAAQNYGRFAMGGSGQGLQQQAGLPPANMGRAFMDLYQTGDRGTQRGGNGGALLPPGLR